MELNTMLFQKNGPVALITLNRPQKLNALNSQFVGELQRILQTVEEEPSVKVVIITGAGKAFSAGADISEVQHILNPKEALDFNRKINRLFNYMEDLPNPVIAAVNGPALGGGCELAMACDFRIASENAVFGLPEVNIGVMPGAGGTQRLPRLVGQTRAKEMLFLGEPVAASEALRIGLVNKVVPGSLLMEESFRLAEKLAQKPFISLSLIKDAVNKGAGLDLKSAIEYEGRNFSSVYATEDQKEGLKAFLEKRTPLFKGR